MAVIVPVMVIIEVGDGVSVVAAVAVPVAVGDGVAQPDASIDTTRSNAIAARIAKNLQLGDTA